YQPFPLLANKSLNMIVRLCSLTDKSEKTALIQVPELIKRTIQIKHTDQYVLLEEVIIYYLNLLFPNDEVISTTVFRITRNADMTIHEEDVRDLLKAIESELHKREWGAVVRLEID